MIRLGLVLLVGCGGSQDRPLRVVEGPSIQRPDNPDIYLAREFEVRTNHPTRLQLEFDDREIQITEWSTTHRVPLLGLRADRAYDLKVNLVDRQGRSRTLERTFETLQLPVALPQMEILAHDPEAVEPGFLLIGFHIKTGGPTILVVYDDELEPVWVYDSAEPWTDMRINESGNLYCLNGGTGVEIDFLGEYVHRWTHEPELDVDILWEGGRMHYDFLPTDEGFASITFDAVEIPEYPVDYDTPDVLDGPATIRTPNVVLMDREGGLIDKWPLYERLDPTRIGWNSLSWNRDVEAWDWGHANAVAPAPDGYLVSLRHQDVVVKLDLAGELQWILGNHDGWSPELEPFLLDPVGELEWQYHQHAPMVSEDGQIVVFDNHNRDFTPYDGVPDDAPPSVSRIVAFQVDPVAMTVEQTFSYEETVNGSVYSPVMGDADWQPQTGNVLATFASTNKEAEVSNLDNGWGKNAIRLIEVEPATGRAVLDVRFYSDPDVNPDGWWSPRTERIPAF